MNIPHTPGPWHIELRKTCSQFATAIHIVSADKIHIAEVGPFSLEANAQLIAAAPELLAALKDTMRTMRMHHGADCKCMECVNATEAITKAGGKP